MTAKEAKVLSAQNGSALEKKKADEAKRVAVRNAKAKIARHKKWRDDLIKSVRQSISFSVEDGETEFVHTLHSHTGRGPYADPLYGEGFLKKSEYKAELTSILRELKKDGYTVGVVGTSVEHEDRSYDGEFLGTSWSYDTVLTVSW